MRGFATHPIEFMPKLLLILRFYRSAMLFFCGAVSVALAWLVPLCLAGKMVIYPVYLYVWIIPRYNDEFDYYRNLGVRRRMLLGASCGIDLLACYMLLIFVSLVLYEPL